MPRSSPMGNRALLDGHGAGKGCVERSRDWRKGYDDIDWHRTADVTGQPTHTGFERQGPKLVKRYPNPTSVLNPEWVTATHEVDLSRGATVQVGPPPHPKSFQWRVRTQDPEVLEYLELEGARFVRVAGACGVSMSRPDKCWWVTYKDSDWSKGTLQYCEGIATAKTLVELETLKSAILSAP